MVSTVYPADAVEFCPDPNHQALFACGTYSLDKSVDLSSLHSNSEETSTDTPSPPQKQRRRGTCLVFELNPEVSVGKSRTLFVFYFFFENLSSVSHFSREIQEISLPAVPDIKW